MCVVMYVGFVCAYVTYIYNGKNIYIALTACRLSVGLVSVFVCGDVWWVCMGRVSVWQVVERFILLQGQALGNWSTGAYDLLQTFLGV